MRDVICVASSIECLRWISDIFSRSSWHLLARTEVKCALHRCVKQEANVFNYSIIVEYLHLFCAFQREFGARDSLGN